MNTEIESATVLPDAAAVFASALSLWQASQKRAEDEKLNLSECFNGMDQFMREIMCIATQFEQWACQHVEFKELNDVWSYLLEDKFGETCLAALHPIELATFDDADCLRVAIRLQLPVIVDGKLPVPVDVSALNPVAGSSFKKFRIQTVRDAIGSNESIPYTSGDEPFDEQFDSPYFGLYGVNDDGLIEFIASRPNYSDILQLAHKLAPGIFFSRNSQSGLWHS